MTKRTFKYILILFALTSCGSSGNKDLIKELEQSSNRLTTTKCCIVLKDVTKFTWDRAYIFPDWSTSDTISKIIGFHYDGGDVQDDYSRILFTHDGKVTYEEDFKTLEYGKPTIDFIDMTDDVSKSKYITLDCNATFSVEIVRPKDCKGCLVYKLKSKK